MQNKFLSYFRYYKDEKTNIDFSWWYCITDCAVYNTSQLYELFGYSSKSEIIDSDKFIEFDKVDIIELKRKYCFQIICNKNHRKYKFFELLSDNIFDVEFNKFIDANNLIRDWYQYEKNALEIAFLNWTKLHNVIINQFN